ncbi:MAG: curli assembly protein CsgF [Polaromonas sp.]|nr:curli assembly protein CsgF [Polaromonas sp.]
MKKTINQVFFLTAFVAVLSAQVQAGELRYVPVNPLFGGNPGNASGLLSIAGTNNTFTAPKAAEPTPPTALEKFTANIESAIAGKLQTQVVNSLFDAKGNFSPAGSVVTAGNFQITITSVNGDLVLVTKDKTTLQETTISIGSFLGQ